MSIETSGAQSAASPPAGEEDQGAAPAAAEVVVDANAAESSNADEGAQPKDLLSVVKDAVQPDEGEAGSPAAEGKVEDKPADAEDKPAEGEAEDKQAEADKKLPFHEHPRWKEVIAERDGYKEDAGRFREVTSFMEANSLTGDEVTEGFAVMADLKSGDPERLTKVRDYFASRLAFLDEALGNVLPDDLRERVESGLTDEDTAQELAKQRARAKIQEGRTAEQEKADADRKARETAEATVTACATAVDAWEKRQKQSDPDYAKKADLVETTCRAIVQQTGKPPATPEEAVALVEAAYKRVNDQFKGLLPTPKAVRPNPTGSSAAATPQPKSLRDAIKASIDG